MTTKIAVSQTGQLPKEKGPELNDRDRINDILAFEKYLSNGYNVGLNEAQNPKLHKEVQNILISVHDAQYKLFNLMFEKGWYKMPAADKEEISNTHKQFSNYSTQFPSF